MKTLKEQIKDGEIGSLYLFYGEERYLVKLNQERIRKALMEPDDEMMNMEVFHAPNNVDDLRISVETLPFMTEKRLVVVEESKAFGSKPPASLEGLAELVKDIPETTTLIFVENEVDKRSKMYKAVTKYGQAMEFARLKEQELGAWIRQEMKRRGIRIGAGEIAYFLSLSGDDMAHIEGEINKLASYLGDRTSLEKADMDAIMTPSLEASIFKMTDALAEGRSGEAYAIYRLLLQNGEPIQRIVYMIIRHFRFLYKTALLPDRDAYALSQELKIQTFAAGNYKRQAARFSPARLEGILERLLETDEAVKTGQLPEKEAADLILLTYLNFREK